MSRPYPPDPRPIRLTGRRSALAAPDSVYALGRQYAELAGDKAIALGRLKKAKASGDGFAIVAADEALADLNRRLHAVHRQVVA